MTFLQTGLLLALPLVFLPLIIHLINQWRYQSRQWGAMMFLLTANKMSRGYARLRKWLIMAMRMLAIAGVIFAVARPLASGLLGLSAGASVDTTILLIDRSPSMAAQSRAGGENKLQTGLRKLRGSLDKFPSNHWVLIDTATGQVQEFDSLRELTDSPAMSVTDTSADWQSVFETTADYIRKNSAGRTEVWICSDLQESEWDAAGGKWSSIRDSFQSFSQPVRFHLLGYDQPADQNLSIVVGDVRLLKNTIQPTIALTILIERSSDSEGKINVPVSFEISGIKTEKSFELTGNRLEIKDYQFELPSDETKGWGRVALPLDTNASDNEFFFTFDAEPPRKTVIVADNEDSLIPLELAASITPDGKSDSVVERISRQSVDTYDWSDTSLLIWQGNLPIETESDSVTDFLALGRSAIFLPPESINSGTSSTESSFLGNRWVAWKNPPETALISSWRSDQDILAATRSGASLPVGQIKVNRYAELEGEHTPLASFSEGSPLIARALLDRGRAYFCSTSADGKSSSLASNGVVLYIAIQRAQQTGLSSLGDTDNRRAGLESLSKFGVSANNRASSWEQMADIESVLSTENSLHAGIYSKGDELVALNRNVAEDSFTSIDDEQLSNLFGQLDWNRVADAAGSSSSILQEIWRLFVVLMIFALIIEAILCLPRRAAVAASSNSGDLSAGFTTLTKPNLREGFDFSSERNSA